jgi:prepilin-type processing-associated H-X9-DG protein
MLSNNGAGFSSLYCPGTSSRFTEQDNWTMFTYYAGAGWSTLGYVATLPSTGDFYSIVNGADGQTYNFYTNINSSFTAQKVYDHQGNYWPVLPAVRGLVADANLTDNTDPPVSGSSLQTTGAEYDWAKVADGSMPSLGKPAISAHLNGNVPLGANVGMLDGHVQWQPLTNMLPRAGDYSSPYFYW